MKKDLVVKKFLSFIDHILPIWLIIMLVLGCIYLSGKPDQIYVPPLLATSMIVSLFILLVASTASTLDKNETMRYAILPFANFVGAVFFLAVKKHYYCHIGSKIESYAYLFLIASSLALLVYVIFLFYVNKSKIAQTK